MARVETSVKVLYVVGVGRSGSTILDIVLGNHPDIQSTGEVTNLVRTGWISHESLRGIEQEKRRLPLCTCGRRLDVPETQDACPFWSDVRREWLARLDDRDEIESYPTLQDAFERERRWPRLLYEARRGPSPQFLSYARLTRALFESVRAASGRPVVVDSSKPPVRAFALSMVPGVDLHAVHNVRDVRGYMATRRKTFQKDVKAGIEWDHQSHPAWRSMVRWVYLNLQSEWVCSRLGPGRAIRLRHEDFAEDPEKALKEIGGLVSLDLSGLAQAASSRQVMRVGHNIGGSRIRKSENLRVRTDAGEWKNALSTKEQWLSWALMGPLLHRYGYKKG